ncbi:MAG: sodium:proton antiporter [Cyanobacteria bacterium QS_6_48_18]|nr:MAG: sodium:proton antiporter [Cyanobacteria bacterium QS_6_48_18]
MADATAWVNLLTSISSQSMPLLATAEESEAPDGTLVLAGVLLSLIAIYIASKVGGELCSRINLPPVLGELLGGVVVGTSALQLLVFPDTGALASDSLIMNLLERSTDLNPEEAESVFEAQSEVITILSELGVIILLFEIGLESDLQELIRVGPQAAIVAVVGVIAPFVAGTAGLLYIFDRAALTATSIGITAKVLSELGRLSAKEGQIIIGAAVLDDILGIVILAVVASLVKTGEIQVGNILYLVASAGAFLIGVIIVGRFLGSYFVRLVNQMNTRGKLLLMALVVAFTLAYVATIIQLEAILGAFAAGLVLAETEKRKELEEQVSPVADIFVPVFFVYVGAKTDLSVLNPFVPSNREGLILAAFLILVAIVGKAISGFTIFGQPELNKLSIGVGMIPRGEVGLVFAGVGSASGALSESTDAAIIVMVILTTFIAPPLLRFVFKEEAAAPAQGTASELTGGKTESVTSSSEAGETETAQEQNKS